MSSCFFTGHRVIPKQQADKVKSLLNEEILNKINSNVTIFIAGGALGFDTLAAEAVLKLREDYDISLHLFLPCTNQDESWSSDNRRRFAEILNKADKVFYVTEGDYKKGCMQKRNRAMVEFSDCGIAYMTHSGSGTYQTIRFAAERRIPITNIAESIYI